MFEIELFICIKMDLALNNLQWLICYKTKTNQTSKIRVLVCVFTFFYFHSVVHWNSKIHMITNPFFLLILVFWPRLGVLCLSKSQRILWIPFSWTNSGFSIYNSLVWSNFNLLYKSQWIIRPSQLCLVLYSLCSSLLY